MDATTRLKLEELRKEAFKRLETDKRRANMVERHYILTNQRLLESPVGISEQMYRDLRIYPIYDCLAMWLDPYAGLAHYAPELLLDIGERLLQLSVGVIHED